MDVTATVAEELVTARRMLALLDAFERAGRLTDAGARAQVAHAAILHRLEHVAPDRRLDLATVHLSRPVPAPRTTNTAHAKRATKADMMLRWVTEGVPVDACV